MTSPPPASLYEAVWNTLPQAAAILDEKDRFAHVNGAGESFLGISARALKGKPATRVFGEASRVMDLVGQARRGPGVSVGEHGMELSQPDRPPRIVDIHVCSVPELPGSVLLLIHPQSIAERMDRSLTHRAAARSVIGLSAMLAHEIKNPLAGISGAAQLLSMQLGDGETELCELIREEADRVAKLLEKVEQFGDNRPMTLEPVNIHDVLDRAKLSAASGFAQHVRIVEEFDPSLPPTAGDADQLMQVFLNLLKNAAEAAPQVGGLITLRTSFRPGIRMAAPSGRRESLPLQIAITDNGPGVPDALKRDIFEPFVTSKATGSGLGLALVSKIVAQMGGVVECESDPGWTTFRLLLPVWTDPAKAAKPRRKPRATPPQED